MHESYLRNLRKSFNQVSHKVHSVATYYPGMIKVYVPKVPYLKMLPDWEAQKNTKISFDSGSTSNETNLERSLRRSQKTVRDLLMCNQFNLWITFTIADDRYAPERSKNKVHYWLKNQRNRKGKSQYVLVPEHHKDGALHFHAAMYNYHGELAPSFTKSGRRKTKNGRPIYQIPSYKSGYTDVQYINQTTNDRLRVANYISKYITKDMVSIFNKKRYWASQGLAKPSQEDNPQWYLETTPDEVFENEYGKILTYKNLSNKILPEYIRSLTDETKLWF